MWRRIAAYVARLIVLGAAAAVVALAVVRRDHTIELVAVYRSSPPAAVWRLLTEHDREPQWLPVFGTVTREPDTAGHAVWTHRSRDRGFSATVMTVSAVAERRYERLLLRQGQPRSASWDGRWVYELTPLGDGTQLRITEYGWTDGVWFFVQQRVLSRPDAFLQYYARRLGDALGDVPEIAVLQAP